MPAKQETKNQSKNTQQQANPQAAVSALNFLEVAEIRDDVVILREGQMRAILAVSSANFALKSTKEQDMLIGAFQGVLNSLDSPIQILIQSRKLDLTSYIDKLKHLEDQQMNDLLKVKMQEYIEYIQEMLQQINIMNKDFFVVVGYDTIGLKDDLFSKFKRALNPTSYIRQKQEDFIKNRQLLMARADQLSSKLSGLDLKVDVLKTEQIIALMYNSYNPDAIESIRIRDVSELDVRM